MCIDKKTTYEVLKQLVIALTKINRMINKLKRNYIKMKFILCFVILLDYIVFTNYRNDKNFKFFLIVTTKI